MDLPALPVCPSTRLPRIGLFFRTTAACWRPAPARHRQVYVDRCARQEDAAGDRHELHHDHGDTVAATVRGM